MHTYNKIYSMNYNLCVIASQNWPHYACLNEVVLYFYYMLKNRSNVEISFNHFSKKDINIIFHAFTKPINLNIPKNSIIFQSEDLNQTTKWIFKADADLHRGKSYFDLINQFPIIDFSKLNLDKIAHDNKVYLPLLYCEDLKFKFDIINKNYLLFFGALTDHRLSFLKKIKKYNLLTIAPNLGSWGYGMYRDKLIAESTAILNLHKSAEIKYLETVRVFYSLINSIPVISEKFEYEKDDYYKNSIFFLRDLDEMSLDNLMSELSDKKEQKKRIDFFKSFDAQKIFYDCFDRLKI